MDKDTVWALSCDWEGQIALCTSYEKAFELGKSWNGNCSSEQFQKELKERMFCIEEIPLNRIYF